MLTEVQKTQIAVLEAAFENERVRPISAACDETHLHVTLADERTISVPLWWYPLLFNATAAQRLNVELMFSGIHWPEIDEDISVKGLLMGWRSPQAKGPSASAAESGPFVVSIGTPLPPDWETLEPYIAEGAACALDYRSKIHDRIDLTYEHGRRFREGFDYDRFYAATDTLLDVSNILHVARSSRWPKNETVGQLWMYGAMQALIVQQDAARQLMKCFGIENFLVSTDVLDDVADLRIAAVGHPSNHTVSKKLTVKGSTFLSHREHGSLTKFNVVSLRDFNEWVARKIDVPELISSQQQAVEVNLAHIWKLIKDDPSYDRPE